VDSLDLVDLFLVLIYFAVVPKDLAADGAVESVGLQSPACLSDPKTIDGEPVQFDSLYIKPVVWVILSSHVLVDRPLSAPHKQVGNHQNLGLLRHTKKNLSGSSATSLIHVT
jgi:hypothetical protein